MLAHVPAFGRNPRGSPDFLAFPVPNTCMHVLGTRVPRCSGVARSASRPKAAQALKCSLTPGLRISFRRVTCMALAASVPGLWTLGFLLLRGACVWVWVVVGFAFRLHPATPGWGVGMCVFLCAAWGCVLGLGFQLRPATPGRGVGVCVCLCARSAFTPPLLAGVCGVGVLLGFVSRLRPATPSWGVGVCVCLCVPPACTPPLLAGPSGFVSACVRAPLAPCHSWLVCGVGVCASAQVSAAPRHSWLGCLGACLLVCTLHLFPATPGWGVQCGCCAWARVSVAPRHSWLGWRGLCLLVCAPRLHPATPGWGVRCGCVCLAPVSAAPRHSWLGCWAVCVLVCLFRLYPATPGWGVRRGCVCLGSGFRCAPPLLARLLGCVCVCVRAPLVPRPSWVGCAVWTWVSGLGLRLFPATRGWGAGVCVCLCACSACTPPLLAGVCGVHVCALA